MRASHSDPRSALTKRQPRQLEGVAASELVPCCCGDSGAPGGCLVTAGPWGVARCWNGRRRRKNGGWDW